MRLAFLILAHHDAPHLERLCRALQPNCIFVHVDGKAKGFPVEAIAIMRGVTLVQPSIKVHWGDFSVIEATLSLIRAARTAGSFSRYILISGECYPIKPLAVLKATFAEDPTREWINLTPITRDSHLANLVGRRWRMTPVLSQRYLDGKLRAGWNRISKMIRRDLQREIQMIPYFGSQWWALTNGCIAMILEFVEDHPAFVEAYRSVYAPDEHFFHTIIGNSHFGSSANHVEDRGSATNQLMPLHVTSAAHNRYFGTEDGEFTWVRKSNALFIRKVSSARSAVLLDWIDHELLAQGSENL